MIKIKYTKKAIFGAILIATLLFTTISGTMFINTDSELTIQERINIILDRWNAAALDLDPGNGNDGIVNWYIYTHSAAATYDAALLEANAYEHFDDAFVDGEELEGETPHGAPGTFDIIVEYQIDNDGYNDTSADWDITLVDAWFNESQLSISSQIMEKSTDYFDQDGTTDAKINFYLLDADGGAGSGFTIGQLEQINDMQIKVYEYK